MPSSVRARSSAARRALPESATSASSAELRAASRALSSLRRANFGLEVPDLAQPPFDNHNRACSSTSTTAADHQDPHI
jgi:hypothetical protein